MNLATVNENTERLSAPGELNKSKILQAMPGSMSELSRKTGLSYATVWKLIKHMRPDDPLARECHIVGWMPLRGAGRPGTIYGAGLGDDFQGSWNPAATASAKRILQSMPGTARELAYKSGYSVANVQRLLNILRAGDPLTRTSHIIGWTRQYGRGGYIAIHGAGPGEDEIVDAAAIRPR